MTAVIFNSPFHGRRMQRQLHLPRALGTFSSDTNRAIPSPALLPCGQQGPTPADGPQRNCQPFYGKMQFACATPMRERVNGK